MSATPKKKAKGSVKVFVDTSSMDSEVSESIDSLRSLECLFKRLRTVAQSLVHNGGEKSLASIGKPALHAGKLVFRPRITSRRFKALRSALRALNLNLAHKILDQASVRKN